MKLTTKGRKARAASLVDQQELEQLEHRETRFEEQQALAGRFEERRLELVQRHRDDLRARETAHQIALVELEREKMVELAKLWKQQGRTLGPWTQRIGGSNGP